MPPNPLHQQPAVACAQAQVTKRSAPARTAACILALAFLVLTIFPVQAGAQKATPVELWQALADGGCNVLMRHAQAPGVGDPDNFTLGDCSTQRLLSAEGRQQAARIGEAFRQREIPIGRICASQWCRTMETAALLDLGPVEPLPVLNSFDTPETAESQTQALADVVSTPPERGNTLFVTHQANIQALTGVALQEGEVLVLAPRDGGFAILGAMPPAP
ncbi:histidine phosphatase family protein [Oceanidesulfovibrio marinus]|uniref:Histidine phosphatase family protein n=1 Tax=Oceanidesulfovibrio marinus TaxID=370038 RepID=A0ABX6NJT8_9BACT|nr:histidine phosphatase family protein [Oceanidesulfovibrio marinus]QJT10905.1 histidine phosphatase family protein [Oceanidesulfovibrio marinus]